MSKYTRSKSISKKYRMSLSQPNEPPYFFLSGVSNSQQRSV